MNFGVSEDIQSIDAQSSIFLLSLKKFFFPA